VALSLGIETHKPSIRLLLSFNIISFYAVVYRDKLLLGLQLKHFTTLLAILIRIAHEIIKHIRITLSTGIKLVEVRLIYRHFFLCFQVIDLVLIVPLLVRVGDLLLNGFLLGGGFGEVLLDWSLDERDSLGLILLNHLKSV